MPRRIQSPSSINLYKQCPRRYFYRYILKYPTKPNIHCTRGNIVHSSLEKFFDLSPETIDPLSLKKELASYLKRIFDAYWRKSKKELSSLHLSEDELLFYYNDSIEMLANWLNHFFKDLDKEMKSQDFITAWKKLMPHAREQEFKDLDLGVRGFIDAIHKQGEHITIIDYKTSKKAVITPEYRLQLGIYALLYQKQKGVLPNKVGIWFLKHKPEIVELTEDMLKNAKFEIEQIHFATESSDIKDYPRNITPLCKYSTGQCDFLDICKPFQNNN